MSRNPSARVRWWHRLQPVVALFLASTLPITAAEFHGKVTFGGLPVPGATVTATQRDQHFAAVTDQQGAFSFPNLADGTWSFKVEMLGFAPADQDMTIAPGVPAAEWELKMLPFDAIKSIAGATEAPPPPPPTAAPPAAAVTQTQKAPRGKKPEASTQSATPPQNSFQRADLNAAGSSAPSAASAAPPSGAFASQSADELNQRASDGFLINGAVNNAAASPFGQSAAFGNARRGPASLYNGSLGFIFDNSALDARPFSLTGQDTPKAGYNHVQGVATLGGPLRIPHLLTNLPPNFFLAYQWTRNRNANTQSALVPTAEQRAGDIGPGNVIPRSLISPQAQALLNLYPLPNFAGGGRYNYQTALIGTTHQDSLQSRLTKFVSQRNQVFGTFAFQRVAADTTSLFGFLDKTNTLGINTAANWQHRFGQRMFGRFGIQFSRFSTRTTPNFANHENISGDAGIQGNNQDPVNWGPPALSFASGIAPLTDAQSAFNRNQTIAVSSDIFWNRGRHNFSLGGDVRRQQFNYLSQQDPRGTFTFTGAATGSDFAGFLLGIPDTSSIAFGNADKYFRSSTWDAYFQDDWRIGPSLTVNAGLRWEYGSPITELYGRLVNLDIAPGFAAITPVLATNPAGSLTNQKYPDSLVRPDKHGLEPRIGIAWRPIPASSLIVRAGYGVYYNTSVYQAIAAQMAQQSPLSKSLTVENTAADPLTLADGFTASRSTTTNTFAIDPNFRVGYAQNWMASVQRDLPGSMVMTVTYLGIKGTRGAQEFLPNTFPAGAANPCLSCPTGFAYLTSNGNSTRESGQIQLRRRLHNGFTATLQYTYSKSIDDVSAFGAGAGGQVNSANTQNQQNQNQQNQGGPNQSNAPQTPTGTGGASPSSTGIGLPGNTIAQNWLNLSAERGLSNFDQRHLLNVQLQYTTGMGLAGGTLLGGWRGALFKEWNILSQIAAGSGLPLTPVYVAAVNGTGVTGSLRPDYTGASLYGAPPGFFLNPAAYAVPASGTWGNAARNSITGPAQFTFSASLGRTFRLRDRLSLDLRVDSTNPINHVTYQSWNTTINSAQFGLPTAANAMRSLQTSLRLRF